MDFPSFTNRYVPHRPLPPFPSDHHHHNHHHRDINHRDVHHLPPPPFHPPLPPPPLYPSLPPAPPPPPPFNPHQSNFTFLNPHRSPPRVSSNRTPFTLPEFENPYPPPRPDSWPDPPPRVSPYRPTSSFNPEFELNSRSSLRDGFIDSYVENRGNNFQNQSQRLFWDRNDDDEIDNSSYRYKIGSYSHNSNFTSRENYESCYSSGLEKERFLNDIRDENRSWGSMEVELSDKFVSARNEPDIYDPGRSSYREREEREDTYHTPKKQIQKKSVLLRIGKPNDVRRNRSHDQHFGSSRVKGKESIHRIEEERERSPDLDVSFKSNSLVAKAIVTDHSSPGKSNAPRNRKIRKASASNSPSTKLVDHSVKLENSTYGSGPPSSETTPKKVQNNAISSTISVAYNSVGSSAANGSVGDTVTSEGQKKGRSCETPSYRIRKKKKVASLSSPTELKLTKKDIKPTNVDSFMNAPVVPDHGIICSEEQMGSVVLAIKHDDGSPPSPNVESANKFDKLPRTIVFKMDAADTLPGRSLLHDSIKNSLTHISNSPSPPENETKGTSNSGGSAGTSFSNLENASTELQDGVDVTGIGSINDVSKQSCQRGISITFDNDSVKGISEGVVATEFTGNASLSNQVENKKHEGDLESYLAVNDACNVSDSGFGVKKQENITVSNIEYRDASPKQSLSNEVTSSPLCCKKEAYLDAVDDSNGGHGNLGLSTIDGSKLNEDTTRKDSSYAHPSSLSSSNIGFTNHQVNGNICEACPADAVGKPSFMDGAVMYHDKDNNSIEECQGKATAIRDNPATCSEEEYNPKFKKKRNIEDIQLDLSSPTTWGRHLNVISVDENTIPSFSVNELVPAGERGGSCGTVMILAASPYLKDEGCVEHGSMTKESSSELESLVEGGNSDDRDEASPICIKKRKVFAPVEKTTPEGDSAIDFNRSADFRANDKSGHVAVNGLSIDAKSAPSPPQDNLRTTESPNPVKLSLTRKPPTSAVPKVFTNYSSSVLSTSKMSTPVNHNAKSRSWHRTGSSTAFVPVRTIAGPVSVKKLSPSKSGKLLGSYIRKGNSLVRKPGPVSALPPTSQLSNFSVYPSTKDDSRKKVRSDGSASWLRKNGSDEIKKSSGSETRVGINSSASCSNTGVLVSVSEGPKTSPLLHIDKTLDQKTIHAGDLTSSLLASTPSDGCSEMVSVPMEITVKVDIPKISEDAPKSSGTSDCLTGMTNDLGNHQNLLDEGKSGKKIAYVKRKSYQLIASTNAVDEAAQDVDKTQVLPSDSYYKRRKNQLIRATLENHTMPGIVIPNNTISSEGQRISRGSSTRSLSKRQFSKALAKMYKPTKFASVWRLCNTQLSDNDSNLSHQKSHLYPRKRATYFQSSIRDSDYSSNNSSLSLISRKLLLSRKRDTVYTRSRRGFSLRISKLLSVGGSSLKWSKSIEKNSKRANEEATRAVAAVQRKKREQNKAPCVVAETKKRSHFSRKSVHSKLFHPGKSRENPGVADKRFSFYNKIGVFILNSTFYVDLIDDNSMMNMLAIYGIFEFTGERVFRIGSVRYKMDPTRRTLQRISDEEPSSEMNVKKFYVPRRLLIGNDEYVRIGNGNKLIRDPKKRTRTLASEKIRWSLHTARLRLARKNNYCQFFTRFGKCNKDNGKCPYIHDPSKIAVCTKFLSGSCLNPSCKLTHKVIPERMQDCSYYQQGLCSNKNCPYRHVNVNANASICGGFLKGYCADGDECRKKHTYVCPIYEATGICTQGSICKLHHPKQRSKGMKNKSSRQQKNAKGRYFGSRHIESVGSTATVTEKLQLKRNDDVFFQEGKFTDFISLNICDEENGETSDPSDEQITRLDINLLDPHLADLDELTKPIRVMYKNSTESSPAIDSLDEKTASYISEESLL